jgi:hypothetical protein
MAVISGNDIGVYVGGTLIGCLTSATFSSQFAEIITTCKDNAGVKTMIPGGAEAAVAFEGKFNPSSTYNFGDLVSVHLNKTEVNIKMGDNTNLTIFALAYLPTLSWTAPLNDASTFSGSFTVNGAWTFSET